MYVFLCVCVGALKESRNFGVAPRHWYSMVMLKTDFGELRLESDCRFFKFSNRPAWSCFFSFNF